MVIPALASLSVKSLLSRRLSVFLSILAIATSTTLVLGVEKVRTGARASFANTISGTDLIVGARGGAIQLMLYSVFRIGNATTNISWRGYQDIAKRKDVRWTVPLSLGDSHRGYRVLGTTGAYFKHYRYGRKFPLEIAEGKTFSDLFDVVVGSEVARSLSYSVGDTVVIAHGLGNTGFAKHDDKPFKISGILKPTGTPVDRTVHVSLEAIEAIHVDWRGGTRIPGMSIDADTVRNMDLRPRAITAFLVGAKSKFAIFNLQREINVYPREPLLAVLPGVALQELWDLMGTAETALGVVSVFVVVSGLLGMVTMLLSGLNERRREMAVLRSVGARPSHIFALLVSESFLITVFAALIGVAFLYAGLIVTQPLIDAKLGIYLPINAPTAIDALILGMIVLSGVIAGLLPAWRAYRTSLTDGMTARA